MHAKTTTHGHYLVLLNCELFSKRQIIATLISYFWKKLIIRPILVNFLKNINKHLSQFFCAWHNLKRCMKMQFWPILTRFIKMQPLTVLVNLAAKGVFPVSWAVFQKFVSFQFSLLSIQIGKGIGALCVLIARTLMAL